jgi:hypothetical protein
MANTPVEIFDANSIDLGTATNPLRMDPTGATTQPVSGTVNVAGTVPVSGSVSVSGTATASQGSAAALSGAWPVELTDGTSVLGTSAHPVNVHLDPNVVSILSNQSVSANGSMVIKNLPPGKEISIVANMTAASSGTGTPGNLIVTLTELDPGDNATALSLTPVTQVLALSSANTPPKAIVGSVYQSKSPSVLVSWTVPVNITFNGLYLTMFMKIASTAVLYGHQGPNFTLETSRGTTAPSAGLQVGGHDYYGNYQPIYTDSYGNVGIGVQQKTSDFIYPLYGDGYRNLAVSGIAASGSSVQAEGPVIVGGVDSLSNARWMTMDASGHPQIAGAASSGSVLANAGNPVMIAGSDGVHSQSLACDVNGRLAVHAAGEAADGFTAAGNPVLSAGKDGAGIVRTCKTDSSGRQLVVEESSSYSNLNAAGTTVVKNSAGHLARVCVNNKSNGSTITLYDNTAGSGTKIAVIDGGTERTCEYRCVFGTGLTAVIAGGSPDITVIYE